MYYAYFAFLNQKKIKKYFSFISANKTHYSANVYYLIVRLPMLPIKILKAKSY